VKVMDVRSQARLQLIGDKWTLLVVRDLAGGARPHD